jgi:hypothetical protein
MDELNCYLRFVVVVVVIAIGGTGIIELAFSGNDNVKVVVSFHGGLASVPDPTVAIAPYTLV